MLKWPILYAGGPSGAWGLWEFGIVIHIAPRWSAEIRRIAFYRHIAPLERKTVFCRDMNLDLQLRQTLFLHLRETLRVPQVFLQRATDRAHREEV